jgi:hypothetical protein
MAELLPGIAMHVFEAGENMPLNTKRIYLIPTKKIYAKKW